MEHDPQLPHYLLTDEITGGEALGDDMRRPFARYANSVLRGLRKGKNTVIDLGEEHGEVPVNNVRFRDAAKEGSLVAYIRQETEEHRVITASVIALGVVATGIYAGIKLKKK